MQHAGAYGRDRDKQRAAYEYNPQATEDFHDGPSDLDDDLRRKAPAWQPGGTPNYKPTVLRWPFMLSVGLLLLSAMVLIIVADRTMPDSDSTAKIMGIHPNATQPHRFKLRLARAEPEGEEEETPTTATEDVEELTISTPTETPTIGTSTEPVVPTSKPARPEVTSVLSTLVVETTTLPKSAETRSTASDEWVFGQVEGVTSSASLPSGASVVPIATYTSGWTSYSTSEVVTIITLTLTQEETFIYTSDVVYSTDFITTSTIEYPSETTTGDGQGGGSFYTTRTVTEAESSPAETTITVPTSATTRTEGTSVSTGETLIVITTTLSTVIIPQTGEFTHIEYTTIYPEPIPPVITPNEPTVVKSEERIPPKETVVVYTPPPVVVVTQDDAKVETRTIEGKVTGSVWVDPSEVTNYVVITPDPGNPAAATQGWNPQPVTQTLTGFTGGSPVTNTIVITPTGDPLQPITYTTAWESGGTWFTDVVTTTPTAVGVPITVTNVEVSGGSPVTDIVVVTPTNVPIGQPVSYTITTTIDGTLTTQVLVATPTGTGPITFTLVTTSGGSMSLYTSTISASTFVTTISGTLRTITSTPSLTSITSTIPGTTRTHTSTVPASVVTDTPMPTVIGTSTRVYKWTQADIFLGTFLPPLLAVALVIPLRVIDLNAKLYQPWHSLPKLGHSTLLPSTSTPPAPGQDTLLLQYTGLYAWVAPVVSLMHGHPVPFITTLMVLCASFSVPLATEAIGLKLHGICWVNTASPTTCGPALGVSPAPAYVLVGVLGVVGCLLGIVAWLVSRWTTGLYANPWSIAGVASLARCEHVKIWQMGEKSMRKAVAEKVYALGFFTNAEGRDEYGFVLLDEAGRGLRSDGEFDDHDPSPAALAAAKMEGNNRGTADGDAPADGSVHILPFMALRYPWRITVMTLHLAVFVFVVYYHAYYRGGIKDGGRLWLFLNSNTFGVRFVSAVIGVIIALCWQAFFISKSSQASSSSFPAMFFC
jgi:hypothetical protein